MATPTALPGTPTAWVVPAPYRATRTTPGGGLAPTAIPATVGGYRTTTAPVPPVPAVVAAAARHTFRPVAAQSAPAAAPSGRPTSTGAPQAIPAVTAPQGPTEGPGTQPPGAAPFTALRGPAATAFCVARAEAMRLLPWFAKAVLQLRPVALPGFGTFGVTEGKVLIVDPDLITAWCWPRATSPAAIAGDPDAGGVAILADVLLHEALHPFLNHASRARAIPGYVPARHHKRANIAADIEIHSILFAAGANVWPWEPCHAQGYGLAPNFPFEWYYTNLPADAAPPADSPAPTAGACGSGATGHASEVEAEADRRFGATAAEVESERRAAAAAITAYASRHPGTVPGEILRHVEDVRRPIPVAWQATVTARVSSALDLARRGEVRTYLRPNRKQGGLGWGGGRAVLAASRAPTPTVWVCVDTSGSMGADELAAGLGVVLGVLARTGAATVLCAFDAALQSLAVIRPGVSHNELVKALRGGGGSDVRPVFTAAEKPPVGAPRPDVMVVFTDGWLAVPAAAPRGVVTVWVTGRTGGTPGDGGPGHRRPAPWGEHAVVDLAAGRVVSHTRGVAA